MDRMCEDCGSNITGSYPEGKVLHLCSIRTATGWIQEIPLSVRRNPLFKGSSNLSMPKGDLALYEAWMGQHSAADALILPLNVPYPEARGATDHQPDVMVATRLRLLDRAARNQCLVGTSHFPFPGMGYVRPHERRWKWQPLG